MTKAQKTERDNAREELRKILNPGDTVYTILQHVSRSGMSRHIRVLVPATEQRPCDCHSYPAEAPHYIGAPRVDFLHPNYLVAKAIGASMKGDAIVMGGCGMDMGFALVYELSSALFGHGYTCLGKDGAHGRRCPSNYHNNHRDTIQCRGTFKNNLEGPDTGEPCHWMRGRGWVIGDEGSNRVCPTCDGKGYVPNPDGPERFDLVHTDGYALRQVWL